MECPNGWVRGLVGLSLTLTMIDVKMSNLDAF
jgi:hypothetical protein